MGDRAPKLTRQEEIDQAVGDLSVAMLSREMKRATTVDRTRAAAKGLVSAFDRAHGTQITKLVRLKARGGALHVPPPWPFTDIVEVGGGVGFIDCLVRTLHDGRKVEQGVRIALGATGKPTRNQIGEAYQRGSWLLKKRLG